MNQGSVIIGNHGLFVRDGDAFTVPGAGTTDRTHKPGATDTSWMDLGILSGFGITPSREERKVFAPSPGRLRLYDVHTTKNEIDYKFTCEEMSPFVFEAIFGTSPLTSASTQFNPLTAPSKKGWFKLQQYRGSDDALFNTVDTYCYLKVDGEVKFEDDVVKVPFMLSVLHSIYNTGTIA